MRDNGIELYRHADTFDMFAGTLTKVIHPRHSADLHFVVQHYKMALHSVAEILIERLKREIPDAGPYTIERQRRNRTISMIRRILTRHSKQAHRQLSSNIWKG